MKDLPEDSPSETYDRLLERLFAGEVLDMAATLQNHPELTPTQRESVAALARCLNRDASRTMATRKDDDGPPPFETLGEFRLLRRLGQGNNGEVYLAEQFTLGRLAAVKVLKPGLLHSPEASARLTREAQSLAKLRHPHIVSVFGFGFEQGVHYIALEYVEGQGLDEILERARTEGGRPTAFQVTTWGRDVARGLEAAHAAGIIHRDVKPSNIRIGPTGRAVLLDFGLALDRRDSTLTAEGHFRGSPRYSSPEQIESGARELDARTDVYSLGVTLYETITLTPPFNAPTMEELFARILRGSALAPSKIAPEIPRELETVVAMAMEVDRQRRYGSAGALAEDLQAILELRDILARPPGVGRRVRKWVRRRPVAASLVASVVLAALAAFTVMGARQLSDHRAFEHERIAALAASERGAFDEALAAWDRALGLKPDDPVAALGRTKLLSRRDQSRAQRLLREGREFLVRGLESRRVAEELTCDLDRLRLEMNDRTLSAEEGRIVARGEGHARPLVRDSERDLHSALSCAQGAHSLVPGLPEARALLVDISMEQWRHAVAHGDVEAQHHFEAQLAECDEGGSHRREIEGLGSVTFDVAPDGAQVYLFRYEQHHDVTRDGERRLVPVPINGTPTPVPPGTWCLRPAEASSGTCSEEVIYEVEGQPLDDRLRVANPKPPLEPWDVLVSVEGETVVHFRDLAHLMRAHGQREKKQLLFARRGARILIDCVSLDELGVVFAKAHEVASRVGFEGTVWRRGRSERMQSKKGATYVLTAAPLFLGPGSSLGRTPLRKRALAPGSYLACIASDGYESQRLPFVLERFQDVGLRAELLSHGSTPPNYRYVPPGTALVGRPHALGSGSLPAKPRDASGFAMLDREVTASEFLAFLNDPTVDPELRQRSDQFLANRTRGHSIWDQFERLDNGTWALSRGQPDLPAGGVSFPQARAFAAWMTERSRREGRPVHYALPTDLEWEKAARGADGRPFTYGTTYHPHWQKSGRSTIAMAPDLARRFPIDESPFGIFDLNGSLLEWCDRSAATQGGADRPTVRGGAWSVVDERRLFQETEFPKDMSFAEGGFRLVIRDLKTALVSDGNR